MFSVLQQAFPAHSRSGVLKMAALVGVFVALFLLFFQPFGLQRLPGSPLKTLIISGYGFVSFTIVYMLALIFPALFPGWFKPEKWTVGKEITFMLFNFMVVGLANFLYTAVVFRFPFSFVAALYFQLVTLSVGIFPVVMVVLWRHSRLLAHNLKLARDMNTNLGRHQHPVPKPAFTTPPGTAKQPEPINQPPPGPLLTITSETGSEHITMPPADFLFAAAADNYVELHFLENGSYKKSVIRSSLSRIEEVVKVHPEITRCHRTYLVNLDQVRSFSGNAQGLKLALNHTDYQVPVSRKMVPYIKALL